MTPIEISVTSASVTALVIYLFKVVLSMISDNKNDSVAQDSSLNKRKVDIDTCRIRHANLKEIILNEKVDKDVCQEARAELFKELGYQTVGSDMCKLIHSNLEKTLEGIKEEIKKQAQITTRSIEKQAAINERTVAALTEITTLIKSKK